MPKTPVTSQTSVRILTQKLLTRVPDVSPSTGAKTIDLSLSRLSFDWRRNYWLTSQLSVLRPSQLLMTRVPDVCPPTVTETKCRCENLHIRFANTFDNKKWAVYLISNKQVSNRLNASFQVSNIRIRLITHFTLDRSYRKYTVQYPKVSLIEFEMSDQPYPAVQNLETRVQSVWNLYNKNKMNSSLLIVKRIREANM